MQNFICNYVKVIHRLNVSSMVRYFVLIEAAVIHPQFNLFTLSIFLLADTLNLQQALCSAVQ